MTLHPVFLLLTLLILLLWLKEKTESARREKELAYLSNKLEDLLREDGREFLRLPTDDDGIKQLAASANRLLAAFYRRQTEAEQFQQSMKQMLTNVSHDLKTPLTVLNGYTEILLQKIPESALPVETGRLLQKLSQKTKETVRLVNQFFELAKLSSGDGVLQPKPVEIGSLCRETLLTYYDILEAGHFMIRPPETDGPVFALADEEAVSRILKNLIDNVLKYAKEGRYLGMDVTVSDRQVLISVRDRGSGISREKQEMIFRRNYHESTRPDGQASGSGLGLTISRTLAERMGGELAVESTPGNGTAFTLRLPQSEKKVIFS